MEKCNDTVQFLQQLSTEIFCEWYWDSLTCWPTTKSNTTVTKPCPKIKGVDASKTISKYCDLNGTWKSTIEEDDDVLHWTDYSTCFTKEILNLVQQLNRLPKEEAQLKIDIAKMIRVLELIGLSLSLLTLIISFAVYYCFRTLRNERTRIHMHLFGAVFGTVLMKLILFINQLIVGYGKIEVDRTGFDSTPVLCEAAYVILEYSKSATYMWMFIEALHLYNAVAVTATKMSFKKTYLFLGWGLSIIFTIIWVCAMLSKPRSHCWFGYNYNPLFWILEGPRIIVLMINTYYLIQIIKVVFVKLRKENSSEIEKLRRTAKSTITLLPLLGITSYITYAEPTWDGSMWYFIVYNLTAYSLNSFQGMFIGLINCLLNTEVKDILSNRIRRSFMSSFTGSQHLQTRTMKHDVSAESASLA